MGTYRPGKLGALRSMREFPSFFLACSEKQPLTVTTVTDSKRKVQNREFPLELLSAQRKIRVTSDQSNLRWDPTAGHRLA